jgi:plastocyanin
MGYRSFVSMGLVVLAGSLILIACTSSAGSSTASSRSVVATEFKFDPAAITVPVGQSVTVTLQNKGTVRHDWTVEGLDQNVQVVADPSKSASVTFTPSKAGTFKVVCKEPAHEQSGMVGQLIVQ